MTVLSFPMAPFPHGHSLSATPPWLTSKLDKLICFGVGGWWEISRVGDWELAASKELVTKQDLWHLIKHIPFKRGGDYWERRQPRRGGGDTERERDGAARGKESILRRATGEMAAVGALEIAWLITAAARPCVVMAGSERELSAGLWQSESERQPCF